MREEERTEAAAAGSSKQPACFNMSIEGIRVGYSDLSEALAGYTWGL
jgi:hypothetical protein